MTFPQRFTLVLLAAFFVSSVATSAIALLVASPVLRAIGRGPAAWRATALASYRLMPAAAATALTLLVLAPGYYAYEQREAPEAVGAVLAAFALCGAVMLGGSILRAIRSIACTMKLRRAWIAAARPAHLPSAHMPAFELDVPIPLVAVLGAVRPRLFVSSAVLHACTQDEIDAIVQHEHSHISQRDNAMRLLMDAAPDLVGLMRIHERIADAWHQAIEHRADDAAARKIDLASALVRVARLAGPGRLAQLPASALYRGESVDQRVKRLLGRTDEGVPPAWIARTGAAVALATMMFAAAGAFSPTIARLAHHLLEAAVSLP